MLWDVMLSTRCITCALRLLKKSSKFWIEKEILNANKLVTIPDRVRKMKSPSENSRLPHISKNWGTLNAHEWKEWVLVYSLYALHKVIPPNHLIIWQTFVLACKKIKKPLVSKEDVQAADILFVNFGNRVQKVLGHQHVTCNMHLHCHLADCIHNFGSIYGFWLFAFER